MATSDFFPVVGEANGTQIGALGATTASAIQTVGTNYKFAIVGTGAFTIRFGLTTVTDPTAASFLIPANTLATFDTGKFDSFKVFNTTGAAINVHYIRISEF